MADTKYSLLKSIASDAESLEAWCGNLTNQRVDLTNMHAAVCQGLGASLLTNYILGRLRWNVVWLKIPSFFMHP